MDRKIKENSTGQQEGTFGGRNELEFAQRRRQLQSQNVQAKPPEKLPEKAEKFPLPLGVRRTVKSTIS